MHSFGRRSFLATCSAALVPAWACGQERRAPAKIGLGFSLYGMKSLPLDDALRACAEIGYDCVELPVMEGWPADSTVFPSEEQDRFRKRLQETGLRLSAVMENLLLAADGEKHASNLARLKAAGELLRRVAPEGPRILETVLGGRPEQWKGMKDRMAARLREWAKIAEEAEFTIAVKAHVGGALHAPEDAVWLAHQAPSPRIKCVYDYSHFQLRGLGLEESLRVLLPHAVFIHVKDAQGDAGRFRFLLPGEGATDYVHYLKLLAAGNYRGDVVVEVSGQISSRPEYRPLDAARRCYEKLAPAFEQAGILRTTKDQ
jgi:inosose dehydratase